MSSIEQAAPVSKANTSKRNFILMLVAFALPVILAKLALEKNWLDYGVTNNGQLMSEEVSLTDLGLADERFNQQWLVMYAMPQQCDVHCEKILEIVHSSYVLLGKEMPRVTPVALSQGLSEKQSLSIANSQWLVTNMPIQTKPFVDNEKIFIADPQGNVFLSYDIPENSAELAALGKLIIADMKKVLKYSRIG